MDLCLSSPPPSLPRSFPLCPAPLPPSRSLTPSHLPSLPLNFFEIRYGDAICWTLQLWLSITFQLHGDDTGYKMQTSTQESVYKVVFVPKMNPSQTLVDSVATHAAVCCIRVARLSTTTISRLQLMRRYSKMF